MDQIIIIADDLTGAADTGVQFCSFYDLTVLLSYRQLSSAKTPDPEFFKRGATALYTNSRAQAEKAARERLGTVARRLAKSESLWIYKKMDSCLRGNPGAETEALMDELAYDASFIAPAFPELKRTTVNGIHLVDGIPVGRTEISRDPIAPVTESDLARVVQSQCRYPVGHIPLDFLAGEKTKLQNEIERQIRDGIRHIVFDAKTRTHIDRIARQIFNSSHRILPVGSAGLAAGLARQLPPSMSVSTQFPASSEGGNHLMVCGTNSEITKRQIRTLVNTYSYEEIAIDPWVLMDEFQGGGLLNSTSQIKKKLSANHCVVTIDSPRQFRDAIRRHRQPQAAQSMIQGLGRLLSTVLMKSRPGLLFLTGGDTADAVVTSAGAKGIRILGEIVSGVVQGTLIGGPLDGLPVVTKAGAFGDDDTLVVLHAKLQGKT